MDYFTYKPLASALHIRLIRIDDVQDETLHCSTQYVKLETQAESPEYSCLSYVWGDGRATTRIMVDGKPLQITSSLDEALRGSARCNPNEFIWADQVCINQRDLTERSQQVRLMNLIFERAQTVLAWLGSEREDTALAIDWINRVGSQVRGLGNDAFRLDDADEREKLETREHYTFAQASSLGVPFDDEPAWKAFSNFYNRPWFERMWVVQEVLPVREALVLCGSQSVDWHVLKAAASWYHWKAGVIHDDLDSTREIDGIRSATSMNLAWRQRLGSEFFSIAGRRRRPTYRWDMIGLLNHFRDRACSDPRDKVYALLGLSCEFGASVHQGTPPEDETENINTKILPDYAKSVLEVFRDNTREVIKRDNSLQGPLNILIAATPHNDEPGWPTWVPDWGIRDISDAGVRFPRYQNPSGSIEFRYLEPPDENSLRVEGHVFGRIIYASPYHHGKDMLYQGHLRESREDCRALVSSYPTHEAVDVAWAMSLVAGYLPESMANVNTTPEQYANSLIDFIEFLESRPPVVTEEEQKARWETIKPYQVLGYTAHFCTHFIRAYCERRLFVTDSGYIGIGNYHLREGDIVAVLWGLDTACILHPSSNGLEEEYKYVGEAYCHGCPEKIKALEKDDQGRPLCQEFIIR